MLIKQQTNNIFLVKMSVFYEIEYEIRKPGTLWEGYICIVVPINYFFFKYHQWMLFECRVQQNWKRYMGFPKLLIKQKSWSLCTNVYLISHYIKDINYRSRKSLGTLFLLTENISYTQKTFIRKNLTPTMFCHAYYSS